MVLRSLSGTLGTLEPVFFLAVPCRGDWSLESSSTWCLCRASLLKASVQLKALLELRALAMNPPRVRPQELQGLASLCIIFLGWLDAHISEEKWRNKGQKTKQGQLLNIVRQYVALTHTLERKGVLHAVATEDARPEELP